jgi:hypothetical protein
VDDERSLPDYLGPDHLAAMGWSVEDMRRCPGATELIGLDGRPCWRAEDVALLRERTPGRDLP